MSNESTSLVHQDQSTDLLNIIKQVVTMPNLNIDGMERLLAMQERVVADQRKTAFMAALARLQAKVPQIRKDGKIVVNGETRSKYAKLEDIDKIIRPLCAEEGFSFSFDEEWTDGKSFKCACRMGHEMGHSETKVITLPLDISGSKNSVQGRGSTQKYAQRYLIAMHINLMTREMDDDGNGGADVITDEQAKTLETMLQDAKADRKRFLLFMRVGGLEEILAKDYKKALNAIEVKQRGGA